VSRYSLGPCAVFSFALIGKAGEKPERINLLLLLLMLL